MTFTNDKGVPLEQKRVSRPAKVAAIEKDDTPAQVALKQAELEVDKEVYETQEGVYNALRERIISNVHDSTICELKDDVHGYARLSPFELLQHLEQGAEKVNCMDIQDAFARRDVNYDPNSATTLKAYFIDLDKIEAELQEMGVDPNPSERQARIMHTLQQQNDETHTKAINTWTAKTTTAQTWKAFKAHFSEADRERRITLKVSTKTAGDMYHSASNAVTMEQLTDVLTACAEDTENNIYNAVDASKTDTGGTARRGRRGRREAAQ